MTLPKSSTNTKENMLLNDKTSTEQFHLLEKSLMLLSKHRQNLDVKNLKSFFTKSDKNGNDHSQ
jgi:hypothetical protein